MGWFPSMFASTRCSWKVWWATHSHTRITWSANSLDIGTNTHDIYNHIYILLQLIMCICLYVHMIHLHLHLHLQHPHPHHHHHHHHHHRQISINVASCDEKSVPPQQRRLVEKDGQSWPASDDPLRGMTCIRLDGLGNLQESPSHPSVGMMQVGPCGSSTLPSSWT